MITYVDTSVVVKLVIDEPGSRQSEAIWDNADALAASKLGYVAVRAALAAANRARRLVGVRHAQAVMAVDALWDQLSVLEVTDDLVVHAAELAERHRLRGYDAVHLGSALLVGAEIMASADRDLCRAAAEAGLHVANPTG